MSGISPIITFKAGLCDANFDVSPPKIKPLPTRGFLYLYYEDDLIHFCWRGREASLDDPELDLIMVPMDGYFKPYLGEQKIANTSPINGRVFVLKFRSSSERKFFWLQSREQPAGQMNTFSPRDLRMCQLVDSILQGNDGLAYGDDNDGPAQYGGEDDDDQAMEDVQEGDAARPQGGAGTDATGGDVTGEGAGSRDGGADGGRANDSNTTLQMNNAVQDFLSSLGATGGSGAASSARGTAFTTLPDLLASSTTIPMIDAAEESFIDNLLMKELPPALIALEMDPESSDVEELDQETIEAVVMSLEPEKKREIVKRVLRSPQFAQSLMSLTGALRDGGVPNVSQALGIQVKNGGYTGPDRRVPLEGGEAMEAFLDGTKDSVKKS